MVGTFLSLPPYPDVPDVPGVPAVARLVGRSLPLPIRAIADALDRAGLLFGPQWGIFDSGGAPVLIGDSVVAVEYIADWRISDFPVEGGGFASYNKVQTPFRAVVTFTVGGPEARRAAFLAQCDAMIAALDLYQVVTPEAQYLSANVTHHDYRRVARDGASLIQVNVWLEQVRVSASTAYTTTKAAQSASPVSTGAVQAQPLPAPTVAPQ